MQDQNPRSPPREPQPPATQSPPQSQPAEMMLPLLPPPQFHPMSMPIPPQYPMVVMPPPMHYHNPYMLPPHPYQYLPNDHAHLGYERNWSTELFDCFMDMKTCLKTTLCPCITFGQIAEIVNEGQTIWYEPTLLYTIIAMIGCFTNEIIPTHLTFLYTFLYRTKMRERYKLRGSKVDDCCVHFFCEYCALCQEYRELEQQGFHVSLGWQKNKERERQAMALYQYVPPMPQEMMR